LKINEISVSRPIVGPNFKNTTPVQFSGLKNPATKCMFVFDLDGTLANGSHNDIQKIIELAKKRTAKLIYATGRSKTQLESLQKDLANKSIILPTPDYLVGNNGQYVYENIDGILVQNMQYETELKAKTNFNSKEVFNSMKNLANSEKYKFNPEQLAALKKLDKFEDIKSSDPDFYKSKLSHYEWTPSEFMSEWFVAAGVDMPQLKEDIAEHLAKSYIITKFIETKYSKAAVDHCPESMLLQANPLRTFKDGGITALDLCPATKADGVVFLKDKIINVPFEEIVMAGDGSNDISMAELAKKGANFICLNNSSNGLREIVLKLLDKFKTIHMVAQDGAKGILEGITKIIINNESKS